MKRIIWHWTAGTHKASALDKKHYHFIIEGDGTVVKGDHAPEANETIARPNDSSTYAAHTRNCNTGAIGVAVAAMAGAVERPFKAGRYPITTKQMEALVALTSSLSRAYAIPVTRTTVLSHAEVQPTLGIAQRGKWDIAWLPEMKDVGDPVRVGDRLRTIVLGHNYVGSRMPTPPKAPATPPLGIAAAITAALAAIALLFDKIFGG